MLSLSLIEKQFPQHLHAFKRNMLREYLQYKILEYIYATEEGQSLVFMGGTALRIVHQHNRFSEDLDFDNRDLEAKDLDALALKIGERLRQEGYQVEIQSLHKNAYHCKIKIPNLLQAEGLSHLKEEKILIQLDAEAQNSSYAAQSVLLNRFDVLTRIRVVPIATLLAQKLYAAFRRKRIMGRDFYDIMFLWPQTEPDYGYLTEKLGLTNKGDLKAYLENSSKNIAFTTLAQDLRPFVFQPTDARKVALFPDWIQSI